jgi:hypothetical protein
MVVVRMAVAAAAVGVVVTAVAVVVGRTPGPTNVAFMVT